MDLRAVAGNVLSGGSHPQARARIRQPDAHLDRFKPTSWAKWRNETPDSFVFSLKASRFCTNCRRLADDIEAFLALGAAALILVHNNPSWHPILMVDH
jgi:hypothetical protein